MNKILGNEQGKIFLTDGNKGIKAIEYPTVISPLNITPTTSSQIIGQTAEIDGYAPINVAGVTSSIDSNIIPENIKKDISILGVTGVYERPGKYKLLESVYDDNDNFVGKVSGFHVDAQGNEYAVVFVTASENTKLFTSGTVSIPNMPLYASWRTWEAKETATQLTDLIVSSSYTSPAAELCRSYSFTIDNVTYYGQICNYQEMIDICRNYTALGITRINTNYNTSNQRTSALFWAIQVYGNTGGQAPNTGNSIAVVLEIPNQ
jgi:hypothetical protein